MGLRGGGRQGRSLSLLSERKKNRSGEGEYGTIVLWKRAQDGPDSLDAWRMWSTPSSCQLKIPRPLNEQEENKRYGRAKMRPEESWGLRAGIASSRDLDGGPDAARREAQSMRLMIPSVWIARTTTAQLREDDLRNKNRLQMVL